MPDGTSNAIAPSFAVAQSFVTALTGNPDSEIRLRFLYDDKKTELPKDEKGKPIKPRTAEHWGTLKQMWPLVLQYQQKGYGTFYFINEVACDGYANDKDVTAIRVVATDHDTGLPEPWAMHEKPSLAVHTSQVDGVQKGQLLWLVSDAPVEDFKVVQQRLAAYYGSDKQVVNASRVFRLPGTLHLKDPTRPQLVTYETIHTEPYTLAQLTEGLPPAPQHEDKKDRHEDIEAPCYPALCAMMTWIDPATPRAEWFPVVRALSGAGPAEERDLRRRLAHDWMAGELYRRAFVDPGGDYRTEEEIDRAFDAPDTDDSATLGTIFHHAELGGWRKGADTFGQYQPSPDGAGASEDTNTSAESHPRIHLMTTSDLMAQPDLTELVSGMLMEGENIAFVGPPKSGKTFLALDISLSLAAALKVVEHHQTHKQGPVIYLSAEGHSGMKYRLMAWAHKRGKTMEQLNAMPFHYNKGVPLTSGGLEECKAFIEAIRAKVGQPVLVVIDTMARSLGSLDENAAASASEYFALTEGLRNGLGCTTLTLAHASNKPGVKELDFRGSSGFSAGFDAVWTTKKGEKNATVEFHAKWLKEAEDLGPFYFRLEPVVVPGCNRQTAALVYSAVGGERESEDGLVTAMTVRHALVELKAGYGKKEGVSEGDLTVYMAGAEPALAAEEHREWLTRRKDIAELLRKARNKKVWARGMTAEYAVPGGKAVTWLWFFREDEKPQQLEDEIA